MQPVNIPVSRRKHSSIYLAQSIIINKPVSFVFDFLLTQTAVYYTKFAVGHRKFDILETDRIEVGSFIDCEEWAGNQEVRHRYEVKQIIPNRLIYYTSCPSKGILRTPHQAIETTSNTYVYHELVTINSNATQLSATIIIQLPNFINKLMAQISGTKSIWNVHLTEELLGAKREIEAFTG